MNPDTPRSLNDLAQAVFDAGAAERAGKEIEARRLAPLAEAAAWEMWARLRGGLRRTLLFARIYDDERLERLAHDAFSRLWLKLRDGTADPRGASIAAFANGIARKLTYRDPSRASFEPPVDVDVEDPEDEDLAAFAELLHALKDCIARLPEELRRVIEALLSEVLQKDLASEVDRAPAQIGRRKKEAFAQLERCLARKGHAAIDMALIDRVAGRGWTQTETHGMDDSRGISELLRALAESEAIDDPGAWIEPRPSCLSFERCAEIGRPGVRPSASEADHLATCAPCIARVRSLASAQGLAEPVRGARRWPLRVVVLASIAGAAALALAVLWPRQQRRPHAGVELAVAPTIGELFTDVRGFDSSGEFFVGVRLDAAGNVRLLFVDDLGEVHSQALEAGGARSVPIEAGYDGRFGAYRRDWTSGGEQRSLELVFVVVTPDALTDEAVDAALARLGPLRSLDEPAANEFEDVLADELNASVERISIDG